MRASRWPLLVAMAACEPAAQESCGPAEAVVERVIDGDTIAIEGDERVRYLLVDAPELDACFGQQAAEMNRRLVEGEVVTLRYDLECTDDYDRLLAWVGVDGREINLVLVERGLASVLHIPPNGDARVEMFLVAQARAKASRAGLWGACGG